MARDRTPANVRAKGARGVKNPGAVMKRLMNYAFRRYAAAYAVVAILIFVSVFASVQGTLFIKTLIDGYIKPMLTQDNPDFHPLAMAIGKVAGFYLIGVVATYIYNLIMTYVAQGTMRKIRDDIFTHMEKLPLSYFDTHSHGDIMSIYTNDTDTLRQMVGMTIPQLLNSSITIVSVLISMIVLSVPLTVLTLVMVGIMMVATKKLVGLSGRYFVEQQKNLGRVNGFIEEMISGQKVVKVFCHEDANIEEFNKINEELYVSAREANGFVNCLGPINAQIGNLSYVLCAIVGGILAINGITGLTLGGLASFLTFNKSFNMPINQVSQQFNSIVMAMAGADRIFKLLDEEPEVNEGEISLVRVKEENGRFVESAERTGRWAWKKVTDGEPEYTELLGKVEFNNVDFGYVPDKQVLHDINMFAKPGQKIALVGSTGAGKTTITNLINRFYDIQDGEILYDGINVKDIRKEYLRRSLGIVLQDTHLFTGTVMENIRYGKLDATDEEVVAAAKMVNADGFIRRLPDGYDTVLKSDGAGLSQGQRQLLAIARAAVQDPPALILDEATSSIDTRTERIVQEGMDKLMHNRTTFVIAHRLSTIMNANCIMVIEQGRIVERGTHEELLEQKGRYYQLFTGNSVQDIA